MKTTKTQHTPGPWRLNGNGTLLHPVSYRSLTTCRIETSLGSFEILDETNEPEQNAALIAAAPDLLQALERAEKQLAIAFNPGGDESILSIGRSEAMLACNQARAAIAKATQSL